MPSLPIAERELTGRLWWLCQLRWLAATGIVLLTLGATRILRFPLPVVPLLFTGAAVAAYNLLLISWIRGASAGREALPLRKGTALAHLQIGLDLVALAAVIHLTGGVGSPLAAYLIFHMIIASTLLSMPAALAQATFATALYGAVAVLEAYGALPHRSLGFVPPELHRSPHAALLVLVMASVLYASVYLAGSIVERLRERERELEALTARLEEQMQRTRQAYEQKQAAERVQVGYTYRVAHELRRPLAAVASLIGVIHEGLAHEPLGVKTAELMGRATARVQQAQDMVSDLLLLSQARETPQQERRSWVDLHALVEEVLDESAERGEQAGVSLHWEPGPHLEMVWAQAEGLHALLRNLVSNALKYTLAGGSVTVRATQLEGATELRVADTGIGIPAEELPHIFEEFFRAPRARERDPEGTGLGLAIVKTIVDIHGGLIRVDSEPDRGTTFTVTLPHRYPELEPHPQAG